MAKNFIQPGEVLTVTAPVGGAVSGSPVLVGNIFGIANYTAAAGDPVEIETEGVWELAKVSAQAWAAGQAIYWDAGQALVTTTAAGNTLIGAATELAANPSATGKVALWCSTPVPAAGVPATATFAYAAGAANVAEVTVTVKDAAGNAVAAVHNFDLWLSDDADGQGLTGTTASGAVAAKAASGVDLQVYTAKKAQRVQSLKTGVYVLSITDTAKTTFRPCVSIAGRTVVGAALAAGNYG